MCAIKRSDVSEILRSFHGGEFHARHVTRGLNTSPGMVTIRNMVLPDRNSGAYSSAGCVFDPVGFTHSYTSVDDAYHDYIEHGITLDVTLLNHAYEGDAVPIVAMEPISFGSLGRGMLRGAFGAFVWSNSNTGIFGYARIRTVFYKDRTIGIPPIEICDSATADFRVVAMFTGEFEINDRTQAYEYKKCFAILVPNEVTPVSVVRVSEARVGTNGRYEDVKVRQVDDTFYANPTTAVGFRKFPDVDIPSGMLFVADRSKLLYPLNHSQLATVTDAISGNGTGSVRTATDYISNVRCDFGGTVPVNSSVYISLRIDSNSAVWYISGIACTNISDLSNDLKVLSAKNHAISVAEDDEVVLNALQNATYPTGRQVDILSTTTPTNGTVHIVSNMIIYTPRIGFSGSDSFRYTITDGTDTSQANVTVTVNPKLPVARPDSIETPQETPVTFSPIANDTVAAGKTASVATVTQGKNGSVVNRGGGLVTYTPHVGFVGLDSFTYTLYDGTNRVTGTVTVLVTPE